MKSKYSIKFLFIFIFTSIFSNKLSAQEEKNVNVTVGLSFQNDMQYLGRKDSIKTPVITPNIRVKLKNGIFAEIEGFYDTKQSKIAGGYGAAGYEFDKDKWGGSAFLSQYIFNNDTNLVKSELSTGIGASLYYNFGFVTANVEPNYTFGNSKSFVLGTGLSKDIEIKSGDNQFEISPKVYTWFGNQSFVENHYETQQIHHGKSPNFKTITTTTTTNVDKFQLMDIEASVPVSYSISKFKIFAEPLLAFPQNYKKLGGYYSSSDYPDPIFIFKFGVNYTF